MSRGSLPDRPNLENLKKQAKTLLSAARAMEEPALQRFRALPSFARMAKDERGVASLALHDAQSVIAREHGFDSWNALREEVEALALTFEAAVDEFVRCATGGAAARARRLLALHPAIATATLQAALVLGDADEVARRLDRQPDLAAAAGGPQQWEPILYACHTCLTGDNPASTRGLVRIVRDLCARGGNPNAQYHWNWHPELPRTPLWGALAVIRHLPQAEALLEAGANPTDGVSMHIAGGAGDIAALELLLAHGADVNGIPGGVPPLVYMMGWATNPAGPAWLLEHGADPNLPWGSHQETAVHVAARRWDVPFMERLERHGGDLLRRRADHITAHTIAELAGNHDVALWLLAHGATDELSTLERFVAACARGDRASADAMLVARPPLRSELQREHHLMLHRPAESGNAGVIETMVACGFDPGIRDNEQVTPLHRAAMGGHPDAVRVLLAFGAPVNALDGMFSAPPLVWAVEGRGNRRDPGDSFVQVARLLIQAGSSLEWVPPAGAPSPERTQEGLIDLRRAAAG